MVSMAKEKNTFVEITASTCGLVIAALALTLIFASEQAWIAVPVTGFMVVLGIVMGYLSVKK